MVAAAGGHAAGEQGRRALTGDLMVERDGALTRLTLNRPDKLNAMNAGLTEALIDAVTAARDDGTRLVVLSGAGRGFSGGFDFGGLEDQSDGDLALRFLRLEQLLQAVFHARFGTLALAHGACFGAAADLVSSCARRVAAPGTRFRMPGLQFGVVLGTRRLAHVIGAERARRLLEAPGSFDAKAALQTTFIHEILPQDKWADAIAAALASTETLPEWSQQALLGQTTNDTRDADMAALAASVARPGLKSRMTAYASSVRKVSQTTGG